MPEQTLISLQLPPPLDDPDAMQQLLIDSAAAWIEQNTSFRFVEGKPVPANVKMFIIKYCQIMIQTGGVASESVGVMSQSFFNTPTGLTLRQYAAELLGEWFSACSFTQAKRRWR